MEKIAIIGLSCLFPDAQTPEEFWHNLVTEKNSISMATEEQMGIDPELLYDPIKGRTAETGKYYCKQGGYIRNFNFDPTGYKISPELLKNLDFIYQWSLYVSKQALQDSGYLGNLSVLAKCGIILGNLSSPTRYSYRLIAPIYQRVVDTAIQTLLHNQDFKLENLPLPENLSPLNILTAGYPSAIVAQALSLSGINFSLDAACASSLYAIRLACDYLIFHKADLMLAGAISCTDPFMTHSVFSLFQAYQDDGVSRPFDKSSGGLMSGEGAGMLVLKRYNDALRDGDKIYATILSAGLSNDGRGKHFLSPNPKGQILAFERAYTEAGINPQSIDYVECHATGTPLGDRTEVNSMETFFRQYGASPLIGSVKSNLGHLLTAAGMPSLIKVILSMSEGFIPATIHVREALSSEHGVITAENVVTSATPWPGQATHKRAAVSAFGFGGTNSHLILERGNENSSIPSSTREELTPVQTEKMAIVGMEAFFGPCKNLDEFERCIYEGLQQFIPLPECRWQGIEEQQQLLKDFGLGSAEAPLGAYIKNFEMDYLHFRIPPDETEQPIPQQLLILRVAEGAIKNAGLKEGANVAVIIAMGTELTAHKVRARCDISWQTPKSVEQANILLSPEQIKQLETIANNSLTHSELETIAAHNNLNKNVHIKVNQCISFIGNIMASRISALWDFSGPSFTVSAEENSTFKALDVAQMLLTEEKVDAVVVGSVDLTGGIENVLFRNQIAQINTGKATLSYDRDANGWLVGEGAGAVVLKRLDRAKQSQDHIYAVIDAISIVQENSSLEEETLPQSPVAKGVSQACLQAFQQAGIKSTDIGYLEVFGSGIAQEDEAEISGLLQAYRTSESELSCAIGSVKANIGHTYAASGMASLIKTVLCLYNRYIPATPQWSGPKKPEDWRGSPFYVPTESRLWSLEETSVKRFAAINGLGIDQSYTHLILSEDATQYDRSNQYLKQVPFYLFPLAAADQSELLEQLRKLEDAIAQCSELATAASQAFEVFQTHPQAIYKMAIVGHNKHELSREIQHAFKGVVTAFEKEGDWKTPIGSYFTARPLGKEGNIAFVYPGMFNGYLNMCKDLNHLFPKIYSKIYDDPAKDSAPQLNKLLHISNQLFYPRSLERLSKRQLEILDKQLADNSTIMLLAGVLSAHWHTTIIRDYFQVYPQSALGYCLGEVSMIFALDVWGKMEGTAQNFELSSLFKTRLSGPKNAVREAWGLPQSQEPADEDFWSSYVLMTSDVEVRKILNHENHVYLTHINTPKEVVIAGNKQSCMRVIENLQCDYFPAPASDVIHCQPMHSEYNELVKWLDFPVQNQPLLDFYWEADDKSIALNSQSIAHTIAKALCQPVDFPRLINRVYEDSVRIFIELGPGGSCSRWIRETLKQKPHVAMSINRRGMDDHIGIIRVLAQLLSHQVPVNLSPLYFQAKESSTLKKSLVKTVTLGGSRISEAILTEENQKHFAHVVLSTKPRQQSLSIQDQMPQQNLTLQDLSLSNSLRNQSTTNVVFDEAAVIEVATGKLSRVFGKEYEIIDSYPRCTRVPMPPYLFLSRVTALNAKSGCFEPCSIETEYDIPQDAWYAIDDQVPAAIPLEASHANIFLASYLGVDFESKGQRIYRNLGGTTTFLGNMPRVGETLRCKVNIKSFSKSGDTLLFFFTYECFVGERMIMKMESGGGFFSDEVLKKGQGIILSEREKQERLKIQKQDFEPLLVCEKSAFNEEDLFHISTGNIAACFGDNYYQNGKNFTFRLPPLPMCMIDRITSFDPKGGAWGLGFLVAEKTLDPEHWYFNCHFKDDFCLPGTLIGDGCTQLLGVYMLYLGLQTRTDNAWAQPIPHIPQIGRYRGQIKPTSATLTFQLEVTKIGLEPQPFVSADAYVLFEGRTIAMIKNVSLRLVEKYS
jgi:PfaB family protein